MIPTLADIESAAASSAMSIEELLAAFPLDHGEGPPVLPVGGEAAAGPSPVLLPFTRPKPRNPWKEPMAEPLGIREPTAEELELALTCPTQAALNDARLSGNWYMIRRAVRAHEGWLRDTGIRPAVEQDDPFRFGLGHQTASVGRPRHHTH